MKLFISTLHSCLLNSTQLNSTQLNNKTALNAFELVVAQLPSFYKATHNIIDLSAAMNRIIYSGFATQNGKRRSSFGCSQTNLCSN